jgi:hypothetical protein
MQKKMAQDSIGPVVILNASQISCDALVTTSSNVTHVPLSRCTLESTTSLVEMVQIACGAKSGSVQKSQLQHPSTTMRGLSEPSGPARVDNNAATSDEIFQDVLGTLWTSVMEPILSTLELKAWTRLLCSLIDCIHRLGRKRTHLPVCGFVPLDRSHLSPFMRQASIILKMPRPSPIILFHHIHRH